ncbi:MAG: ligase-associated DNA damage response exonuclease [Bacteroidota bacterium]
MLTLTPYGLYCEAGDFFVDPWQPVDRAVITHAHADHMRPGSRSYLGSVRSRHLMRARLGEEAAIESVGYGEVVTMNGVRVSLHPAGHVLGSAQVRVEHKGEVWVVTGDWKAAPDPTCEPFELVPCDTFITESTFGLPLYQWPNPADVCAEINAWWRTNQAAGKASVVFAYSLGKAQRVLMGVDASIGPIYCHGAPSKLNEAYRASGIDLPKTTYVGAIEKKKSEWAGALIVAPTSAAGSPWMRRFGVHETGFASGWMRIRGARRRRSVDRGFVLSDHADWPNLTRVIEATGAKTILPTHGYTAAVARWCRERGLNAEALETRFAGEAEEPSGPA